MPEQFSFRLTSPKQPPFSLAKPPLRSSGHGDGVCLDSEDGCVPSFHDDADGYGVRSKAPTHHARADGVRRGHVYDHARALHADARARVVQSSAARPHFPSERQQSEIELSDYRVGPKRRSVPRRMAPVKNMRRFSPYRRAEAPRRTG